MHPTNRPPSSTLWYELAYLEAKERIKKAYIVWQVAFGSGLVNCNNAIWKALRIVERPAKNPWMDCIDSYPVEILEDLKLNLVQYRSW